MIVDVLYRAGDGKRHGWRVRVGTDIRPRVVTVWGTPEQFGLSNEKAMTEALCRNTPTCARMIVIAWVRFGHSKHIYVGECRHVGKCKMPKPVVKLQQASA
jgi:hypothetical protein